MIVSIFVVGKKEIGITDTETMKEKQTQNVNFDTRFQTENIQKWSCTHVQLVSFEIIVKSWQ